MKGNTNTADMVANHISHVCRAVDRFSKLSLCRPSIRVMMDRDCRRGWKGSTARDWWPSDCGCCQVGGSRLREQDFASAPPTPSEYWLCVSRTTVADQSELQSAREAVAHLSSCLSGIIRGKSSDLRQAQRGRKQELRAEGGGWSEGRSMALAQDGRLLEEGRQGA